MAVSVLGVGKRELPCVEGGGTGNTGECGCTETWGWCGHGVPSEGTESQDPSGSGGGSRRRPVVQLC